MTCALVPTVRRRGFELGAARARIVALIAASGCAVASMNERDIMDPWGRDYRFRCTGAGPTTLDVWSAGPDRQHGTDDDIRSNS